MRGSVPIVLPETLPQAVVATVVAMPGLIYASVRTSLGGYRSADARLGSRVLHAVVVGVLLDLLYVAVFGSALVSVFVIDDKGDLPDLRQAALVALVLGAAVPAAVAAIRHGALEWIPPQTGVLSTGYAGLASRYERLRLGLASRVGKLSKHSPFEATPTAWDWAAPHMCDRFVRVRMADGTFLGGFFGGRSYISTYPEPHDIFIGEPWELDEDGKFLCVSEQPAGIWVSLTDGSIVEWIGEPLQR